MNSVGPMGRPLEVLRRIARSSAGVSPPSRNFRQLASHQALRHVDISRQASASVVPQWAAALDQGQASASAAIPARTGFSSA